MTFSPDAPITTIARAALAATLLWGSSVLAQSASVPPPGSPAPSQTRVGLDLVGMPWGSIDVLESESGGGDTPSPALGIMPFAEAQGSTFFVGIAPRLIVNVRDSKQPWADAGTFWNVLLRFGASTRSDGPFDLYGYVTPGLAWLVRPFYETSTGILLGAHLGVRSKLTERMFWTAEVGAEKAYTALAYSFLQVGVGIGWRFESPDRSARRE